MIFKKWLYFLKIKTFTEKSVWDIVVSDTRNSETLVSRISYGTS